MNDMDKAPRGMGIYLRVFSSRFREKFPPEKLAKILKDHGIKHAYMLAVWHDEKGFREPNTSDRHEAFEHKYALLARYGEALTKAGVSVGIWGFPMPGHERAYFDSFVGITQHLTKDVIKHWLHDPEKPWKVKGAPLASRTMRGQGEAVGNVRQHRLGYLQDRVDDFQFLNDLLAEQCGIESTGVTSYGMAQWHKLPWVIDESVSREHAGGLANMGWSSPQLYSVSQSQVDAGLAAWRDRGSVVFVPSVPVFGKNANRALEGHLRAFVDEGTPVDVTGMIVWSFRQMNMLEGKILHKFSEEMGWA